MDGEAGWWTTSGNIGLPPLARVMGVGRQQHGFRRGRSIDLVYDKRCLLRWVKVRKEEIFRDMKKVNNRVER